MLISPNFPAGENSIFDTHAHFDDERFSEEKDVFGTLKEMGVCGVINCGCDVKSSQTAINMAQQNEMCFAAIGIHPELVGETDDTVKDIEKLLGDKNIVAIGEIGLDYHWHPEFKEEQKKLFIEQILLAKKYDLPIIVHDREAHGDIMEILAEYRPKGVMHCFSGSVETARQVVNLGMYIGIGGVVTFKNARKLREVAAAVPLERILLETDAPYMAPEPFRGKTNHSGLICFVAEKIAEIKNISQDEVYKITKQNAERVFLSQK